MADPEAGPDAPLQPPLSLALYNVPPDPLPSPLPPSSPPPPPPSPPVTPPPSSTPPTSDETSDSRLSSGSTPTSPLLSQLPESWADEDMRDCAVGHAGVLGRLWDAQLNVGGLRFRRWGCIGRGRCAIAAVELAMLNCRKEGSRAAMEAFCDERRKEYGDLLEYADVKDRHQWLQQMVDLGVGDKAIGKQTEAQARAGMFRHLLRDLRDYSCNLGWEFFVLAAAHHRVNILLTPVVITGEPIEAVEPMLIPPRFDETAPVIVIYHRAFYGLPDSASSSDSSDIGGHYEVLFCNDEETGLAVSRFTAGAAAWSHLRRLAYSVLAKSADTAARASMEYYYNLNIKVRDFAIGDAVGVRTNATKQRTKKRGVLNVPALVVAASDNVRSGGATTGQRMYTCLTKYGVIDTQIKVDGLTYVSANNHAALYDELRNELDHDTWQVKARITMETAVMAFLAERANVSPVPPPRQQQHRAGKAVGADGGRDDGGAMADDEVKEADVQLPSQRAQAVGDTLSAWQAQQYPIRIVRQSGLRYQVEWNEPPGERTWVSVARWNTLAMYKDLVLEFRARQESADL